MKFNKEVIGKSNIILLSIVFLDVVCIIGASPNIGTTFWLKMNIHDVLNTWVLSVVTINIFFIIPLALWVKGDNK